MEGCRLQAQAHGVDLTGVLSTFGKGYGVWCRIPGRLPGVWGLGPRIPGRLPGDMQRLAEGSERGQHQQRRAQHNDRDRAKSNNNLRVEY